MADDWNQEFRSTMSLLNLQIEPSERLRDLIEEVPL